MMSAERLMYAAQGLSLPYIENNHGGRDASILLKAEEQEEIIKQRLSSQHLPKTTKEEIKSKSVSWFGEGEELPYVEYGEEGLKERKHLVSL